jgi:hypothetical protein
MSRLLMFHAIPPPVQRLREGHEPGELPVAKEFRAKPGHAAQSCIDGSIDEFDRQRSHRLEQVALEPGVVGRKRRFGEAAQHLDAVEAGQEARSQLARLRVCHDDPDNLAEIRVVRRGINPERTGVPAIVPLPVAIADVVGEHGDAVGREIRGNHEQLVLEPPRALGKGEPVLAKERRPEELVRREAVDQRRVTDRAVIAVLPEQHIWRAPDGMRRAGLARPKVCRDPADDDVGVVRDRHRMQAPQCLRPKHVVLVDELDVLAVGRLDPHVARLARPARVLLVDDPHVRLRRCEGVEPGRRPVRGAVVDEDRLELVARHRLAHDRGDAILDVAAGVVDRDDDADLDRHVRVEYSIAAEDVLLAIAPGDGTFDARTAGRARAHRRRRAPVPATAARPVTNTLWRRATRSPSVPVVDRATVGPPPDRLTNAPALGRSETVPRRLAGSHQPARLAVRSSVRHSRPH